ncbi:MAG: Ger(x)C family spore germination protein [Clostridia bacterium]
MGKSRSEAWKIVLPLTLLLVCLVLTGCWDRREIEDIGMVVGMALDKGKQNNEIVMTTQFVNTIVGVKDISTVHNFYNVTTSGRTLMDTIKEIASKTDRAPYFTHMKVILISDEVAKAYDMYELTNLLMRDHEVRRTVQVLIVKGKAVDLLEVSTRKKEIPSLEIWSMTGNDYKTVRMPHVVTLGDISIHLSQDSSFGLQKIEREKDGLRLTGIALINGKTKRLQDGFIDKVDPLAGMAWLMLHGMGSSGGVVSVDDPSTKKPILFEMRNLKRKVSATKQAGKIVFHVQLIFEGKLGEDWNYPGNAFSDAYLHEKAHMFESKIKQQAQQALTLLQKKYKMDVLGFYSVYRVSHYKEWKRIKKEWDRAFSKSEVKLSVQVFIRDYGSAGRKI